MFHTANTHLQSWFWDAAACWEIVSASDCICKYLQSARVWTWASIRCWWQFNWAVMATLVPCTSLQPCDSHSFIGNTSTPGARTETASKVLWPPLPCKDESSWPSCQLPLCLAGISCTWLENGSWVTERCSLMSGVGIISLSQNLFDLALWGTTTGSFSAILVSSLSNNDKWLKPKRRAALFFASQRHLTKPQVFNKVLS